MKLSWRVRTIPSIAASLALAALMAGAAAGVENAPPADPGKAGPVKQDAPAATPPAAGGVMVFIDPATGKIRQPSAEEIGSLAAAAAAQQTTPPKPLVTRPGARGGVVAVLDDSQMTYLVVTKQPDGKLKEQCVAGGQKANEIVASPPGSPAPAAEQKEARDAH